MEEYIIINRIKCAHCGDILVSNNRNDLKFCSCKKVGIDGGREYLRRIFDDKFDYFDLSESIKIDEDYIVVYKELKQKDFESSCHFCNSKKILLYKGDGEYIDGLDFLGYKCDDCKKIYIFSDVKFKLK